MEPENTVPGSVPSSHSDLGTRISEVSKLVGGKKKLAEMAGISESQLHRYVAGQSSPTAEPLLEIARAGNVSVEWLLTGEGPIKKGETAAAKINVDLLRACIGAVNRYLKEKGLEPPDEVRAGLTAALYRYADAKGVADQQDMKEFLKLVA